MEYLKIILYIMVSLPIINSLSSQHYPRAGNIIKCTNDLNCTLNAYCHNSGICYCKGGFLPYREPDIPGKKAYHTVCLKEAAFIGDYCKANVQCTASFGTHAVCILTNPKNQVGHCECLQNAHYKNGACYKTALIGEICEVSDNCLIKSKDVGAYCDYSRCICPPKYHPTNDATDCQRSSGLGGPCLDDAGCMVLNSGCKHGFCICREKYISDDLKNNCLLLAEKLEDPCDLNDQCTMFLQNTICDEKRSVCVCTSGSHIVDETCWKSARFLDACDHSAECLVDQRSQDTVECHFGICQCKNGYKLGNQSYCEKDVNGVERLSSQIFICGGMFLLIKIVIVGTS